MDTILKHAQGLVYALLHLMPSLYQHASLSSLLGLFLEAQGHPVPQHCQTRSASALSRFLNHYDWCTVLNYSSLVTPAEANSETQPQCVFSILTARKRQKSKTQVQQGFQFLLLLE